MKKDKHILLNINAQEFQLLEQLAKNQDRNITNMLYILFAKSLKAELLKLSK